MDCKLLVSSSALLAAACTGMQNAPAPTVPDSLKAGASESVATVAAARGVQIYECKAAKEGGAFEWSFVAPEAELFDASGKKIGKHYAGPHWEANDGSKIVGTVKARADAPQADAIPWLLLTTKSDGAQGSFSRITAVQRVNTVGGVAPKTGCTQSSVGTVVRVPYTADYYLLAPKT